MAMIEINTNPSRAELKWLGLLLALFFGLLGAIAWWRAGAPEVGRTLWGIGGGLGLVYYVVPPLRRPMFLGWSYLTFPIGWTMSHLILGVSYYLVLTPSGLIMRLLRRDPMHRKLDRDATSYWTAHRTASDPARYFRQF